MNEIWTADLINGPGVAGRACYLAGIIDDHSRFLTGHQFVRRPDAVRLAAVLRAAVARHGSPGTLYADYAGPRISGLPVPAGNSGSPGAPRRSAIRVRSTATVAGSSGVRRSFLPLPMVCTWALGRG